jgi:hypothetical protein
MSNISIIDLSNPAVVMNENFFYCKNQAISSLKAERVVYLFVNNKLLYSATMDDVLKYFDEIRYPDQAIDANDPEFLDILLNYTNKVVNSGRSGSRYLMNVKNNETNIKVFITTVCQNKYDNPNLQTKPGIFRP